LKLLSIAPSYGSAGARREIARFSVELNENVRLNHLKLMEESNGRRLVFSPKVSNAGNAMSFSSDLSQELTNLASTAYDNMKGVSHNVHAA
jgi:hypothetical protein